MLEHNQTGWRKLSICFTTHLYSWKRHQPSNRIHHDFQKDRFWVRLLFANDFFHSAFTKNIQLRSRIIPTNTFDFLRTVQREIRTFFSSHADVDLLRKKCFVTSQKRSFEFYLINEPTITNLIWIWMYLRSSFIAKFDAGYLRWSRSCHLENNCWQSKEETRIGCKYSNFISKVQLLLFSLLGLLGICYVIAHTDWFEFYEINRYIRWCS